MEHYIYKITNILNGFCYIGMTSDFEKRIKEHLKNSRRKKPTSFIAREINSVGKDNFKFEIIDRSNCILKTSELEIYWIKELNPHYNLSKGGKGYSSVDVTDSVKEKLREKGKIQWENLSELEKKQRTVNNLKGNSKGFKLKESTKQKIRETLTGRKLPKEHSANISKALKGKERPNLMKHKKVKCIGIDGLFVKNYNSIKDAAEDVGIHSSGITKVLKGEQITAGKFKWELSN